jgi:NAD(P)-dependent dehydrogenase (short-subunit alcohol dehydrogenase family)
VHVSQHYGHEIRVNALAPGFFMTNQNRFLLTDEVTGQPTPRGQKIIEHTPLGRYGKPEELLPAVLWLLSPQSGFVHGATIVIDGGFSVYSGV